MQLHPALAALLLALSTWPSEGVDASTNSSSSSKSAAGTNGAKSYIVVLQHDAHQDACLSEHSVRPTRVFRHALNGFLANLDADAVTRLRKDSRVKRVEEDRIVAHGLGQIIPTGVRRMAVDHFPPVTVDGMDKRLHVDVAVLDSGIQTDHPDLNVIQSVDFTGQGLYGIQPHGTECAGIIGALDNAFGVVGVAPGVRLWSVRHLRDDNHGSAADILSAFDYVASHADQISVCSCSFLTVYGQDNSGINALWHPAIQSLVDSGVVVVACAGNDGADIAGPNGVLEDWDNTDNTLPAAYPEVMAVSGIDPLNDRFAYFSNFSRSRHNPGYVNSPGAAIDVAAPAVNIATTTLSSGYVTYFAGTSAAAPHVAGLAALYIATHGRATNAAGVYAIRQAIVDAALPQSLWHTASTLDPDTNHEGLAVAPLVWATNAPRLLNVVKAVGRMNVRFSTVTGYTHAVQFVDSLSASNQWTALTTTNGTGATASVDDSSNAPSRFYRLSTQPVSWPPADSLMATNLGSAGASADGNHVLAVHGVSGAIVGDDANTAMRCLPDLDLYVASRMEVPYQAALNPSGPFSIELWVMPAQTVDSTCLASSHRWEYITPQTDFRSGWILYQADSTFATGNGFYLRCMDISGYTAGTDACVELPINTNAWYHVVGVYDESYVSLYVDGALAATTLVWLPFRPNTGDPMTFGERSDSSFPYSGDLDEAAFYANALSAEQVLTHYQAGTNAAPPAPYARVILNDRPAGYWRFNEQ
jgi:subtilisin